MKKQFKAIIPFLVAWVLLTSAVVSHAEFTPSRLINIVYDDSGSMIKTDGQLVDTWCQAKYSIEVFAAMLGGNDTMNIYVMSDFGDGGMSAGPRIMLNGMDGAEINVAKVHEMVTTASNTPFSTVKKAYSDLEAAGADEKWLVVLTDGEFQGGESTDEFFARKSDDIHVMFLSIGANAASIVADESKGLYFVKAQTNSEILSKITGICTRIFNSDKLDVNVSSKRFSFDVPMAELTVFAQGANVSINGIRNSAGKEVLCSSLPVTVQYSEQAATNYPEAKLAKGLLGSIATYKDDFAAGEYSVDVTGAETIEIYYKPNVEIAAYLTDAGNNQVTELKSLKSGEYTIHFGFVKAGTHESVEQSSLLGDVVYSATVMNNGITHDKAYTSGDSIAIEEGSLRIDAVAEFLDYNSVSTSLEYAVYSDKTVGFTVAEDPSFCMTRRGIDPQSPIRVQATLDGKPFTQTQWDEMSVPDAVPEGEIGVGSVGFRVEKSGEIGVFNIFPQLGGTPSPQIYCNSGFTLTYRQNHGASTWAGSSEGMLKLSDSRTWLERNMERLLKGAIYMLVGLIVLGYFPPFKKYLPRRLKKRPSIDCIPNRPGVHAMTAKGIYRKKLSSTLLPYKAERGTIKFSPPGVAGIPILKIKGAGGNSFYITNAREYAGKSNITFDGSPIEETAAKQIRKGAGTMISVSTKEMTYTCNPSIK